MAIYAITHNGLPRSQGGRLICYQVGRVQVFPGLPARTVEASPVFTPEMIKEMNRRAKLPFYANLSVCRGISGDKCSICVLAYTSIELRDYQEGEKYVRVCDRCGRAHKR